MQVGDNVRVRATGRLAIIVADVGGGRFELEMLPGAADDPMDRDTVQAEDIGGIYSAEQLEPS